jgi:preprotein translocase subunit SecY
VSALRESISDALVMVSATATAYQMRAAQAGQARFERLQRYATLLTAFLLVPAFVATIFGADVWLPGSDDKGRGLLTVSAMVAGAALTLLLVLTRLSRGGEEEQSPDEDRDAPSHD